MTTNTYYACLEDIYIATSAVCNCILKQIVEDEKKKNEETGNVATHLTVFGDRKKEDSCLYLVFL